MSWVLLSERPGLESKLLPLSVKWLGKTLKLFTFKCCFIFKNGIYFCVIYCWIRNYPKLGFKHYTFIPLHSFSESGIESSLAGWLWLRSLEDVNQDDGRGAVNWARQAWRIFQGDSLTHMVARYAGYWEQASRFLPTRNSPEGCLIIFLT